MASMSEHITALMELFRPHVPDAASNAEVAQLASDQKLWHRAHDLFSAIRNRNLAAIKAKDYVRECQFCFEEICLKSLFNESGVKMPAPFDSDSPYWIVPIAIELARAVGVRAEAVIEIVAPPRSRVSP